MSTVTRVRHKRSAGFTQIKNDALRDDALSFKARGLLAYLMSVPDGWETSAVALAGKSPDGRAAVGTGLQELEEHGYLTRRKVHGEGGQWDWDWFVDDEPQAARATVGRKSADGPDQPPMTGSNAAATATVGRLSGDGSTASRSTAYGKPADIKKTGLNEEGSTNTEDQVRPDVGSAASATVLDLGIAEPTVNPASPAGVSGTPGPSTAGGVTGRAEVLARDYGGRVPLSNHLGVRGIVVKALRAGYPDAAVAAALGGLADAGRSVTVDSLRIELDGPPGRARPARGAFERSLPPGSPTTVAWADGRPIPDEDLPDPTGEWSSAPPAAPAPAAKPWVDA